MGDAHKARTTPASDGEGGSDGVLRSHEMRYLQFCFHDDSAHELIRRIGASGLVQLVDLNPNQVRALSPFAHRLARCEGVLRGVRFLREELAVEGVGVGVGEGEGEGAHAAPRAGDDGSGDDGWAGEDLAQALARAHARGGAPDALVDVEAAVADAERDVREFVADLAALESQMFDVEEFSAVLEHCGAAVAQASVSDTASQADSDTELLLHDSDKRKPPSPWSAMDPDVLTGLESFRLPSRLRCVCGTVPHDRARAFERVVFRVTHGNCVVRMLDRVLDPVEHAHAHRGGRTPNPPPQQQQQQQQQQRQPLSHLHHTTARQLFVVFFSSLRVGERIEKVVVAMGGRHFQLPHDDALAGTMALQREHATELRAVIQRTVHHRTALLRHIAAQLAGWERVAKEETAVLQGLMTCQVDGAQKSMVAEGWCRRSNVARVQQLVHSTPHFTSPSVCSVVNEPSTPPTDLATTPFSLPFQLIVDSYGVPSYREINPMPFTVITFPFLFAVMFGDVGHGVLLLALGLWLVSKARGGKEFRGGEIAGGLVAGRWVIVLMGVFSIYTGLVYNEVFAVSVDLFGSAYSVDKHGHVERTDQRTYPFGVDPVWRHSSNELAFTNSLKMKMAIVMGVCHMEFGLLLSALNYWHTRDFVSLVHVFIPQTLFLTSVFGYLVVCVLAKWNTDYTGQTHCAPSILTTFIDMFLGGGAVQPVDPASSCAMDELVPHQEAIQRVLLCVALFSVPWMLLAKPLLLRRNATPACNSSFSRVGEEEEELVSLSVRAQQAHDEVAHHPAFDFTEEMVHQVIHTIEFVLGAVSNTASYLRLWALSLAHSQLSAVFWEMVMVPSLASGSVLLIVIGVAMWMGCTIGVLMVMESLSAFLHSLRLHWVEFQSKFFRGEGTAFKPFTI